MTCLTTSNGTALKFVWSKATGNATVITPAAPLPKDALPILPKTWIYACSSASREIVMLGSLFKSVGS